jgi:hypothetical protein
MTFSLPEFNLKKQMSSSWASYVDERSESSITWDTDTIPMKERDNSNLSSVEALI